MQIDRRRLVLTLALLALLVPNLSAQRARNWHVFSNGMDATYIGVGAGDNQEPASDGIGTWIDGNHLRGNYETALGEFGYRQTSFFMSACVKGPAPVSLDVPAILFVEFTGRNNNRQDVFTRPGCAANGVPFGVDPNGFLPYSTPPGSSVNFMLASVSIPCNPVGVEFLLPNNGLLPTSNGGSAEVIAAACATIPLPSADECWIIEFTWIPSALQSLDHVDGWWHWLTNSSFGNQYWALSTDELNTYSSNTVGTDSDLTLVTTFFSNVEYDFYATSRDPVLHEVLAPVGINGSGPYYSTSSYGPIGPSNPNGGGNLGRHGGVSISGLGGSLGFLGTPNQSPGAFTPTFGFQEWDNEVLGGSAGSLRTVAVEVDWAGVLGIDPATLTSAIVGPPIQRFPLCIQPVATWPQPITLGFLSTFIHDTSIAKPDLDPTGFPVGSYGIAGHWAATTQFSLAGLSPVCSIGLPVALDYGSVGLNAGATDFEFDPALARISTTGSIIVLD